MYVQSTFMKLRKKFNRNLMQVNTNGHFMPVYWNGILYAGKLI